jgi:hypothetical protein
MSPGDKMSQLSTRNSEYVKNSKGISIELETYMQYARYQN